MLVEMSCDSELLRRLHDVRAIKLKAQHFELASDRKGSGQQIVVRKVKQACRSQLREARRQIYAAAKVNCATI
jgi:hypothetical protein